MRSEVPRRTPSAWQVRRDRGGLACALVASVLERSALLRPITAQEAKATTIIAMPIEEAAAKVRAKGVGDDEADFALHIWAGVIPVTTVLGAAETCHRLVAGVDKPETLGLFPEGGRLDEALLAGQAAYETI